MYYPCRTVSLRRGIAARPPRLVLAAALLGALLSARPAQSAAAGPADPQLRDARWRCCGNLRKESRWVKVHAAEYLLALDYPQGVRDTFMAELKVRESEPQYRIGIWRVLARGTADHKVASFWTGKILEVFADPSATDHQHAVESLAKLGYKAAGEDLKRFAATAAEADGPMAAFAAWVLANSCDARASRPSRIARKQGRQDAGVAAYAVRHLREPGSACGVNCWGWPTASRPTRKPMRTSLRHGRSSRPEKLRPAGGKRSSGCFAAAPVASYHACDVLGRLAVPEDLPMLVKLLDASDADVRTSAAAAILPPAAACRTTWAWLIGA